MCCPLAFLPNELRPQKCKSLGSHSETPRCKTPTNLTVDRCSVQSQAFGCLNCPHTVLLFSTVILFTAKGIYLTQACSGFEPASAVRFRTWTWKSSNTFSNISHSSLHFINFFFGGRDMQRIDDVICTCFCNRFSFFSHALTSNNMKIVINQITAISESYCTFDQRIFFSRRYNFTK